MRSNSLHKPRAVMLHEITPSPVPRVLTVMGFVMLPPGVARDVQPFFIGKGATFQSPEFCSTVYLGGHWESLSSLRCPFDGHCQLLPQSCVGQKT